MSDQAQTLDPLAAAAASRAAETEERVRTAIARMTRRGDALNFASVAREAETSRSFLYGNTEIRAAIEGARGPAGGGKTGGRPASDESLKARLRGTLDENKRLRDENAALREELAIAHGRVRELKLHGRAPT